MYDLSRRQFLTGAAGAAMVALGAAGCSSSDDEGESASSSSTEGGSSTSRQPAGSALPAPEEAPFDTVVVLMMENRSFDHMLGWLEGADGRQSGIRFSDRNGTAHDTWPMAPDWQGCELQDPFHTWQAMAAHYNDGACDGFLSTQPDGDLFPIGYYGPADLPVLAGLAQGYSTFDQYFCSMMGPTWPNRLYQLCATTDVDFTGFFPTPDQPRPVQLETAIFDRLAAAGLTGGYYYFGEPMTGLFTSKKYDALSHEIDQFWADAAAGELPNVTFVDPDYTYHSEFNGLSNDYHPYGSVRQAEAFVARVHDTLAGGPQWERMVFVLNFDESGGFYDHVAPPAVEDDTVLPGDGPHPDLRRLGFRVPAIAMGPYVPQQLVKDGPFEHCSILRMIEWRWGLEPMTIRDRNARNLAEVLDFTATRDAVQLPAFEPEAAEECTNTEHLP